MAGCAAGNLDEVSTAIDALDIEVGKRHGIGRGRVEPRLRVHRFVVSERVGDRAAAACERRAAGREHQTAMELERAVEARGRWNDGHDSIMQAAVGRGYSMSAERASFRGRPC